MASLVKEVGDDDGDDDDAYQQFVSPLRFDVAAHGLLMRLGS